MQRLSPHLYRKLYPRAFGLWAGHLGFSPPATRHWLCIELDDGGDETSHVSRADACVSFRFWWEIGLERNLVFSSHLKVSSSKQIPESEAIWAGHRLSQLARLCAEPSLVMCHSPAIQSFWSNIVKDLIENPETLSAVK